MAAPDIQSGTGYALNPRTGQMEQLYAIAPLDPLSGDYSDFRFASDGLTPQHQSLAGWAPGFHSDNSGTWSNFMERAVLGGLGAIGGVAAGSIIGGAGAGAGTTGAAATDASTGLFAGESANAGAGAYGATGGGATGYAAGASQTLLADAGTTMTDVGPGYGSATQMPAASPEVDPTFNGDLTQTGTGQYENLSGNLTAPSASGNWWDQYIDPKYLPYLKTLTDLAGRAAPAAIGAYGANQQANSLHDLAQKYMAFGEPSRFRYESSYLPGFSMENEPGYTDAINQSAKGTLHALSAKVGNPAGSPNAWASTLGDLYSKTAYPALQQYRNQNAATGGYGAFNAAAPATATGAIGAEKGVYDAIGAGAADIFNPPRTLTDILREVRRAGY